MMATYEKLSANTILNGEKLEAILLKSGAWQGCPLFLLFSRIVIKALTGVISQEKESKGIQIGEGRNQISPTYRWYAITHERAK